MSTINQAPEITCKPLDSLEEVFSFMDSPPIWAAKCLKYAPTSNLKLRNFDYHEGANSEFFCHRNVNEKFHGKRYDNSSLPKTLICHDMANGYHDDSYIEGTSNSEAYHFWEWSAVDTFCYFSHHFITIPPLAWINAAHKHDVKVIGTVITEWNDGVEIWKQILSSPEQTRQFADCLVSIARHLSFEGWLLNVENSIAQPELLLEFVRYLRERLHEEVEGAELIWYDSVTIKGALSWQNELNLNNLEFFRACDGIFTNYSWTEQHIVRSAELATGEGRLLDVYVGVDVWGRNFYGGGKLNTAQAVKLIFKHGCSIAIFAHAWTFEDTADNEKYPVQDDQEISLDKYKSFLVREKVLWDSIWPYLTTRVVAVLPFSSSFCRGNGKKQWRYGKAVSEESWHNLMDIEYQPTSNHGPHGYRLVKTKSSKLPFIKIPKKIKSIPSLNAIKEKVKNVFSLKSNDNHGGVNKRNDDENNAHNSEKTEQKLDDNLEEKVKSTNTTSLVPKSTKPDKIAKEKIVLVPTEYACIDFYTKDAFTGGSCLIINPKSLKSDETISLFQCDFYCTEKLIVYVITKNIDDEKQSLEVICELEYDGKYIKVRLIGEENAIDMGPIAEMHAFPVQSTQLNEVQKYLLIDRPGVYVPIENDTNWKVRYYILDHPGATLTAINCKTTEPNVPILLGQLGVCPYQQNT